MGKFKGQITLRTKIIILSLFIVVSSILISSFITTRTVLENTQSEIEDNVTNIATTVAMIPEIVEAFETENPSETIQPLVEDIRDSLTDIEFITVTNMRGIRYSHPNEDLLGLPFVGGDEVPVLQDGVQYVSTAQGTLGWSTRAFTPLYDYKGNQIGMVAVGILNQSIENNRQSLLDTIIFSAILGIVFGLLGSVLLAQNIKASLIGLEPHQISNLLTQRNSILEAVREGIVAIDAEGKITLFNQAAKDILHIDDDKEILNNNILDVFPETNMPKVLDTGQSEYDRQIMLNKTEIFTSRVPIKQDGKTIGVIASFRDKSELTKMAEELTGAKMLVDSLRSQTHEFMNKMHVVLGLIQLEEIEDAQKYIREVTQSQHQIISFIVKNIKESGIAALLLGKISSAKELGIEIHIESMSKLSIFPPNVSSSPFITILGNLLENAFDAVRDNEHQKAVEVFITESSNQIVLRVEDNGCGIEENLKDKIFSRGFTMKKNGTGVGLYLIKQNVESLKGQVKLESKPSEGSRFTVTIPKGGNFNDSSSYNRR